MRKIFICISVLCLCLTAACSTEPQRSKCDNVKVFYGISGHWLNEDHKDSFIGPVDKIYGEACSPKRLTGLNFGPYIVYACEPFFTHDSPLATNDSIKKTKALRSISYSDFEMIQQTPPDQQMMPTASFAGSSQSILILTNEKKDVVKLLISRNALKENLQSVDSMEAATTLARLYNAMGESQDAATVLNGATMIQTNEGWRFENVSIYNNCRPAQLQTVTVTRGGEVAVSDTRSMGLNTVGCGD